MELNKNIELGIHRLGPNYGYCLDQIPQNVHDELKVSIDNLASDFSKGQKVNHTLVGEIKKEYKLTPGLHLNNYLKGLFEKVETEFNYLSLLNLNNPKLNTDNIWVNFMEKYEYNPPHHHDGIYSYVIWYQIPYKIEDELEYSPTNSNDNISVNGSFQFSHVINVDESPLPIINSINLPIDKSKEGYIAMFPSSLQHEVFPFYTSDEYRISVAGNIIKIN